VTELVCYVFYIQRPIDKEPWPTVYVHKELAEAALGRVTPVVEVRVPREP
jgi:hypothetical protein